MEKKLLCSKLSGIEDLERVTLAEVSTRLNCTATPETVSMGFTVKESQ